MPAPVVHQQRRIQRPFRHALCAVDGTPMSDEAVQQALLLLDSGAALSLLAVVDLGELRVARRAAEVLDRARRDALRAGIGTHESVVANDDVERAMAAAASGTDLLVVAGRGLPPAFGTAAPEMAVLVPRRRGDVRFPGPVLACVRGAGDAGVARTGARIAARAQTPLVLFHVRAPRSGGIPAEITAQCEAAGAVTGRPPILICATGDPCDRIPAAANSIAAGLVILGSRFSSVATKAASRAPCSVLGLGRRMDP